MKKIAISLYLIFTISVLLTAASWFTWGNACQYTSLIPEGQSYGGMCASDGIGFVGVFVFFVIVTVAYLAFSAFVFKLLGYKLTKK